MTLSTPEYAITEDTDVDSVWKQAEENFMKQVEEMEKSGWKLKKVVGLEIETS